MKAKSCVLALFATIASPAWPESSWPEYLDVDLSYRHSARLEPGQRWDFRLGASIEREPTFQGSSASETEVDPFVLIAYRAGWGNVFLTGGGLGYSKMLTNSFGIQLQLEAEDTREESDDARLMGLGDQEEEVELETVASYFLGPWKLGGSVAVASGDKGIVWFVGGGYTWQSADERLFLTLGADLSGSDKDNQQTDFGITPAQSSASGYPVYEPGGGLKSFGINLNADYGLNNRWFLYGEIDYERLLGDVADSPLVQQGGSENNVEAGVGFYYRF